MNELLATLILLQIGDFITTKKGMEIGLREVNPLLRRLMDKVGVVPALLLAKSLAVIGGVVLWYLQQEIVIGALIVFYLYVVINNYYEIKNAGSR